MLFRSLKCPKMFEVDSGTCAACCRMMMNNKIHFFSESIYETRTTVGSCFCYLLPMDTYPLFSWYEHRGQNRSLFFACGICASCIVDGQLKAYQVPRPIILMALVIIKR